MPIPHTLSEVTLPGGVKGLVIDIPGAPVTKFGVSFHTGSTHITRGWPYQAAHIVEHIAAAHTTDPRFTTQNDLTNEIERQGAYTNASTSSSTVSYYGYSATDEWQRIMGLMRLSIEHPKFDEETLASERGNVIEELNGFASDHEQVSWDLARKALANDWLTSRESIDDAAEVALEHVMKVYSATHTLTNMRFVVAGDMSKNTRPVERLFNQWSLGAGMTLTTDPVRFTQGGHYKYARRRSLTTIANTLFFALDRELTTLDIEIIDVLGYLLFNSQSSRILGAARERGICYGMSSSIDIRTGDQLSWAIEFTVSHDNMEQLTALIVSEFESLLEHGFSDAEVSRAVTYNLGLLRMSGQTAGDLYDSFEADYFRRGQIVPYDEVYAVYDFITPSSLLSLLRELLTGPWALGGVGPKENMAYKKHFDVLAGFLKGVQ